MNKKVIQKGNKYFELYEQNNNQYRIFFRASKNKTPSFSICIIHEASPTKSISYRKNFMLNEFNQYVENYKKYDNIDTVQNELMSSLMNGNIQISQFDNNNLLINILLNNTFKLSFKAFIVHEILESNKILIKTREQMKQTDMIKNRSDFLSNNLQKCEEVNKNNDIKLQNLKDLTTKLFQLFNNRKPIQMPMPNLNNYPSEEIMLTKTKEERYRILGIKSDIVHTLKELFYISRWLSCEKVTKLDLLYKGPSVNFDAANFHLNNDNIVPCLILVEATNGARFGGFTNKTWKGENEYKLDQTAFLFSLDFLEKYPVNPKCANTAILAKTQYLSAFGKGDLIIYDHCNRFLCKTDFPNSYMCLNKQCNPKHRLTKYNYDFIVKDYEVFLVSFTMKNY